MDYWTLVDTILTDEMHPIGNQDIVYSFRIEVFKSTRDSLLRAQVWRLCLFDLMLFGTDELSTEGLWTSEDSFGFDEIRSLDKEQLLKEIIGQLCSQFVTVR